MTDPYPPSEPCPFCAIAAAYPFPEPTLWSKDDEEEDLANAVPTEEECDEDKTSPGSFVVLRSRNVVAFLDIAPMTEGHLLVATRSHKKKLADTNPSESRALGYFLPHLARTISTHLAIPDYNIVQNNGARAAQVVPHVHFHIIPRPGSMPEVQSRSWRMFGRGQRGELDEDAARGLAAEVRRGLRGVLEGEGGKGKGGGARL